MRMLSGEMPNVVPDRVVIASGGATVRTLHGEISAQLPESRISAATAVWCGELGVLR